MEEIYITSMCHESKLDLKLRRPVICQLLAYLCLNPPVLKRDPGLLRHTLCCIFCNVSLRGQSHSANYITGMT